MDVLRRHPVRAGSAAGVAALLALVAGCSLGQSGASGSTSTVPSTAFRTIPVSPPKPTEPPSATSAPPASNAPPQQQISLPPNVRAIYTVKAGDAPASIARRFDVPLEALYEMNGMDPKKPAVYVGQKLQIPRILPPTTTNDKGEKVYIVVAGDSPAGIASKFGMALQTLYDLNGMDPAKPAVYVGQAIRVPG